MSAHIFSPLNLPHHRVSDPYFFRDYCEFTPCFMLEQKVILVRAFEWTNDFLTIDCSLWGSLVAISVIHHYLSDNFISL